MPDYRKPEKWVQINTLPSYDRVDSKYWISNWGRVEDEVKDRFLTIGKTMSGYNQVWLNIFENNTRIPIRVQVSHLVGEGFVDNSDPEQFIEIDHINRIRDDDYFENLRWVNRSLNNLNREIKNSIGFHKHGNGWQASIWNPEEKKVETIGTFRTPEEVGRAYDKRKVEIYGKDCVMTLNFH